MGSWPGLEVGARGAGSRRRPALRFVLGPAPCTSCTCPNEPHRTMHALRQRPRSAADDHHGGLD
jgi:hypothetical protein